MGTKASATERNERYILGMADFPDSLREVTREEFLRAERGAGFRPKSGNPDDTATGGFSGGGIQGSVVSADHWDFDDYLDWLRCGMPADRSPKRA